VAGTFARGYIPPFFGSAEFTIKLAKRQAELAEPPKVRLMEGGSVQVSSIQGWVFKLELEPLGPFGDSIAGLPPLPSGRASS